PAVPPNARKSAIVATARAGLGRLIHFAFMLTSSQRLKVEAGASVGCQEARTERSSHAHTVLTHTASRGPHRLPDLHLAAPSPSACLTRQRCRLELARRLCGQTCGTLSARDSSVGSVGRSPYSCDPCPKPAWFRHGLRQPAPRAHLRPQAPYLREAGWEREFG